MAHYFHDSANEIVYKLDDVAATETLSNHSPPRFQSCDVSGKLSWVRADWVDVPQMGKLHAFGKRHQQTYTNERAQTAEELFVTTHVPSKLPAAMPINLEKYNVLVAAYTARANAAKPRP